ncbi:MAG TPA: bifunctional diaminohydroxyphosphoribosylaminopyrimidine deaminase/5-amino-6-(5-phosphoribosylamino)uracil reductase RibD [Porphyromonadaceae bacterium]|nr:bifunctional diaminohydroxyphosphoribosylaminopyrimidine deaminase/5-amino-6-(5-phosphoribosylamino)uracil reductase RibD [Porphyromonadaceae bacterium]
MSWQQNSISQEENYMYLAIEEAKLGGIFTAPNPMVGAVIVKDGKILGKGHHHLCGEAHAEVNALLSCKEEVKGATIYVTLEPCSHYGKTPPCAEALVKSGIKKVVCSMQDPNPKVAGKGFEILRNAGIEVECGLLEEEARWLNRAFLKHITTGFPCIVVKSATTADGKIATSTGNSKWITNEMSREKVHILRNRMGAILTSISTIKMDNPMLNCRLDSSKYRVHQPVRLIADTYAQLPEESQVAQTALEYPTYLFHSSSAEKEHLEKLQQMGIHTQELQTDGTGHISMKELFNFVGKMGINSVLVEAGGNLNATLWEEDWVDEFYLFIAPKIAGGHNAPTCVEGKGVDKMDFAKKLSLRSIKNLQDDILLHFQREKK